MDSTSIASQCTRGVFDTTNGFDASPSRAMVSDRGRTRIQVKGVEENRVPRVSPIIGLHSLTCPSLMFDQGVGGALRTVLTVGPHPLIFCRYGFRYNCIVP